VKSLVHELEAAAEADRAAARQAVADADTHAAVSIDPILTRVTSVQTAYGKLAAKYRDHVGTVARLDLDSVLRRIPKNVTALPRTKAANDEAARLIPLEFHSNHDSIVHWHRLAVELHAALGSTFTDLTSESAELERMKSAGNSVFVAPGGIAMESQDYRRAKARTEHVLVKAEAQLASVRKLVTLFLDLEKKISGSFTGALKDLPVAPQPTALPSLPPPPLERSSSSYQDFDPRERNLAPVPDNVRVEKAGADGFRTGSRVPVEQGFGTSGRKPKVVN
jgi:hypothetical protein